ncbi:MAG: hypothetical protein KF833_09745 [Verrucomicrobiae bacterium]|nr:hypothetical protein [Verrucomicrobiae bacterium]
MNASPSVPRVLALALAQLTAFTTFAAIPPGVPEPGLVVWGSVVHRTNTSQAIPIQSAHWSVSDGTRTASFSTTSRPAVRIVQAQGQSFYILEVPFDSRRLGAVELSDPAQSGRNSFDLRAASPPTYTLAPTINGVPATVRSVNGAPASGEAFPVAGFNAAQRGRTLRVDLAILPPADSYELWAAAHFGDPTLPEAARDADPDGDGMTNEAEFAAGTDPRSASSVLRLLSVSVLPGGSQTALAWNAVQGRSYTLQGAPNPGGPWTDLGSPVPGSAPTTEVTLPASNPEPHRFYRVRLVP